MSSHSLINCLASREEPTKFSDRCAIQVLPTLGATRRSRTGELYL